MDRYYSLEHNPEAIPPNDTIHCLTFGCRMQVASFNDYIPMSRSRGIGLFNSVINVNVSDNVSNHLGTTVANIYCSQCDKMIGWKIIAVTQASEYITEGRFCMRLDKLSFSNFVAMILSIQEQNFRANEENADQDADTTDGEGDSNDPDLGANDQNVDQDGDTADEGLGANEQNVDQDGDSTDQDGDTADEGLGTNEQNVDQEGDSTDQDGETADEGLGANEQNVDQDGDSNEEYDGSISSYLMHFIGQNVDQDGGANEQNVDQGGGISEKNVDQDGGRPMKQPKI
ncbi:uncharacterized protein LOC107023003 [Solanum pennellii]|uniref:Uncharacterized protein LOC107023003 n=1 Tax=Solanum pennellii TaxID=28526 RepID=A0ABM1H1H4_SOLPN|nr:uncharacterized protein LOC107023003 [Solanum pennellii]